MKCPHCDVALAEHNNGKMICHYCGYQRPKAEVCPCLLYTSYDKYVQEFLQYSDKSWTGREEKAIEYALDKVRRDFDQGGFPIIYI